MTLVYILIVVAVLFVGIFLGFAIHYWLVHKDAFVGTIHVFIRDDGTVVYSLDLEVEPEDILFHKIATFKVDTSRLDS